MPRAPKPHKLINCKMQIDIWNALDKYCNETGVNKTFVIEQSVKEYLEKHRKQLELIKKHHLD